jgi:rSAM/selenodomain-associated transferase 1
MVMSRASPEAIRIAVLAKAPVAGFAKTRLIPALGAHGAAYLQERLTAHAVATAASVAPVTLWCTPDCDHASFRELARVHGLTLARQPAGDLGARMRLAIAEAGGPALVIGTDCPALTAGHLGAAGAALVDHEVVVIPATDGGYVLIGMRSAHPAPFANMAWGDPTVMADTRARLRGAGVSWRELDPLWDIDRPEDVDRMEQEGFGYLLG